jgi:hypothetical protein
MDRWAIKTLPDSAGQFIAVAEVDTRNYTECRKWQAQVIGWQEYYEKIKAVK